MSETGVVEGLHIVRVKRGAPEPVAEAFLKPGGSLPGDHHDRPGIKRPVTLIRAETLDEVAAKLSKTLTPGASRRNVTVRGVDLDALPPGTRLRVGDAELEVKGPCDPCERMETALGEGALAIMKDRGGVVARVVHAGSVRPGDVVRVVEAADTPLFSAGRRS
jgi:MOSC domain-containing protein YiiM